MQRKYHIIILNVYFYIYLLLYIFEYMKFQNLQNKFKNFLP